MYDETTRGARGWKTLLSSLALGFLLAGPALATSPKGEALLESKHSETMSLQLEDVLIQVTEDTRIYDGDGKRISFAQIPDPHKVTTTVEYSGSATIGGVIASELVVEVTPH